jgi:hypothetical protein
VEAAGLRPPAQSLVPGTGLENFTPMDHGELEATLSTIVSQQSASKCDIIFGPGALQQNLEGFREYWFNKASSLDAHVTLQHILAGPPVNARSKWHEPQRHPELRGGSANHHPP